MNAQSMPGPSAPLSPWGQESHWRGQSAGGWQVEEQPTSALVEPEDQATSLSHDRKSQHMALKRIGASDLECIF